MRQRGAERGGVPADDMTMGAHIGKDKHDADTSGPPTELACDLAREQAAFPVDGHQGVLQIEETGLGLDD